jgi:hypothetical protein
VNWDFVFRLKESDFEVWSKDESVMVWDDLTMLENQSIDLERICCQTRPCNCQCHSLPGLPAVLV